MRTLFFIAVAGLFVHSASGAAAPDAGASTLTSEQAQFFEAKVRPVLAQACYRCHSIQEGKSRGGLALDTRAGVQKGGDDGLVIVPCDPEHSRLITAIRYTDADLQMPPKGEKLSAAQIADLEAWVKMGAPDPRADAPVSKLTGLTDKARAHWAYQPVKMPEVPQVKDGAWVRTPVDAFVLSKLEENGMKPSRPANREALIRGATYDLVGLPPTPQEVKAFVNDLSPNAFEKVVDRLLASPQYGERWGRFWLDSARYSDTSGSEKIKQDDYRYAYAWTYRDYVIQSFNEDKPYDCFLKEQIAADLLPDAETDPARLAALGFLTVGKRFPNPNDTIDERIDTLSKATLGLTVACARCHDHKFDPIPTADYYSLHGIFASTMEPEEKPLIVATPNSSAYADYQKKLAALESQNREIYYDLIRTKSAEFRKKAAEYLLASLYGRKSRSADLIERNKLIAENHLDRDVFAALRGTRKDDTVFAPLMWFNELPAEQFNEGAKEVLQRIAHGGNKRFTLNPRVVAAFANVTPDSLHSLRDVAGVYGKLFTGIDEQARTYLDANRNATTSEVTGYDADLVQLINVPAPIEPSPRITTEHLRELIPRLPAQNNGYARFVFADINELELTHPGAPARAMAVADAPKPHDSPIFIRGEAGSRGPIAPRQFLEILSGPSRKPFTQGSGRLELAQAIANRDNPLTARVLINRLWMHHFGEGFVRTPDDLGVQSEPPSHPELLDYLASRFMDEGWSLKKMHRLIMLSSVYQQSSDTNPTYAQKDPENRLLWRANLRRLDFEAIRDTMLMLTGKLDLTLGGKPVNLTDEPYSNRRSVYGYIDRGNLPELMAQFDFSDPDRANTRRTSTIVPQQALFFMNSPMSVDVARKITTRPEFLAAHDDVARVKAVYAVLFEREPKAAEIRLAADFFNGQPSATARLGPRRPESADKGRDRKLVREAAQKMKGRGGARRAIQNEGEAVERKPLTPWEEYVQALLFTNEIAYVN